MGFEPFQDMLYLFGGAYESNSQIYNDMYRMDPTGTTPRYLLTCAVLLSTVPAHACRTSG